MKMKRESEVAQLCLILSDLMDCSLPGSSIHGIFQARVLEWVAIAFSDQGKHKKLNLLYKQEARDVVIDSLNIILPSSSVVENPPAM